MVPRRPPRPCRWTAPPGGGCRAGMVCDMLHRLTRIHNRGRTLIYIIIIGGCVDLYSVRRGVGIWYALEVLRRCDMLQRVAGGIIAAFACLVFAAVEWDKSQEKHL